MNLLKTSIYTSISQGLSVIAGLISTKIISVKIGPEGMAMMGQFLNSTAILSLLSTGAIGTGVVKYLAESHSDKDRQVKIIASAFKITLLSTLIISVLGLSFSTWFSKTTFKTADYSSVYILWALFLVFTSFSSLFSSILNGLKLIPYLAIVNIAGTAIGLLITVFLALKYGIFGVLIAANFTGLVLFAVHLYFFFRYKWFLFSDLIRISDRKIYKLLYGFILMSLTSGILAPFIQLLVRDKIIAKFSFEVAGYWQSVTRISDFYLSFITAVISVYYLPKLSELKTNDEFKIEIRRMFSFVLPIIAILSFAIWLCRYIIIDALLTPKFLPSAELYGIQFLGDIFKISSWLLAYVMLARALKYQYILFELGFSITYVILCFFLIDLYGIIGANYGFLLNYAILCFTMFFFIKRVLS
jgi:PST family polysaccharide transporter